MAQVAAKTQVFLDQDAFNRRKDKTINGVTLEFAEMNPNYEQENATNQGCWNCAKCNNCVNCDTCTGCDLCEQCVCCINCVACKDCAKCRISIESDNCCECVDCSFCNNCSNCQGCESCEDCTDCVNCFYSESLSNRKNVN